MELVFVQHHSPTRKTSNVVVQKETSPLVCNCSSSITQSDVKFCNQSQSVPCYITVKNFGCICGAQTIRNQSSKNMCSQFSSTLEITKENQTDQNTSLEPSRSSTLLNRKGISITWIFVLLMIFKIK
ncbi:hypothetical protein KUTeg_003890 [Tegillarca granosa]|uniref:Uncharacterized protein n=1 Tax=Tegillarca granosa TaxID=220873 RepID=A0ABQ9FNB3_TEGGR|nr:hypothetical protein KUTeg_003890 [Tegillarca granosa]